MVGTGTRIGGLVGDFSGNGPVSVVMSWSAADVKGGSATGGLFGASYWPNSTSQLIHFDDNWAAGNIIGSGREIGGFSGDSNDAEYTRNWSSGRF